MRETGKPRGDIMFRLADGLIEDGTGLPTDNVAGPWGLTAAPYGTELCLISISHEIEKATVFSGSPGNYELLVYA